MDHRRLRACGCCWPRRCPTTTTWATRPRTTGLASLAAALVVAYALMTLALARAARTALLLAALGAWAVALSAVVGFGAALVYNVAALQFVVMCWAQSMVVAVYARVSPRYLHIDHAVLGMAAAACLVWCVSWYGFVVEQDWGWAAGTLVASVAVVGYNRVQLQRTEGLYNIDWHDITLAVLRYYCDDAARLCAWLCAAKTAQQQPTADADWVDLPESAAACTTRQ